MRRDGLKNKRPKTLPASACGSGWRSRRRASSSSATTSSRSKSARSMKRFTPGIVDRVSHRLVDVAFVQNVGGQQAQHVRVAAGAGQNVFLHERGLDFLGGTRGRAPIRKPAPWVPVMGPVTQFDRM